MLLHESFADGEGSSPFEPLAIPDAAGVCSGCAEFWAEPVGEGDVTNVAGLWLAVLEGTREPAVGVAEASVCASVAVSASEALGPPVSSAKDWAISSALLKSEGWMVLVTTVPSLVKVTVRVPGGWKAIGGPALKAMLATERGGLADQTAQC